MVACTASYADRYEGTDQAEPTVPVSLADSWPACVAAARFMARLRVGNAPQGADEWSAAQAHEGHLI